jgi:hypothetical protein
MNKGRVITGPVHAAASKGSKDSHENDFQKRADQDQDQPEGKTKNYKAGDEIDNYHEFLPPRQFREKNLSATGIIDNRKCD